MQETILKNGRQYPSHPVYHPVAIRENIFCNNLKAHKHEYFVGFEKGEMNIPFNYFFYNGVRSFSRPEKLWLKIQTGLSGTVYLYWVEKALLFPNWSSFSRQMPSPYVSNSCGFSLHLGGGGEF